MNPPVTRCPGRAYRLIATTCVAVAALAASGLLSARVAFGQQAEGQSSVESVTASASQPAAERPVAGPHGFERRSARREAPLASQDDSLWQMLQEFYPEKVDQLKALRERFPRRFAQVEREMRPRLRELRKAQTEDPRLAELMLQQHRNEMAIHDWKSRYFAADEQDRRAMEEEGRQLVETRVDLRLQREQMRIQILEKRLQDLKSGLAQRETQKTAIVDREWATISNPSAPGTGQFPSRRVQADPAGPPPAE